MAYNLDAVHLSDLSRNSSLDIAAALNRKIDQHRTRTHRGDHFL